ncbi:MAG: oligosaccharide flippase family protein, partial [Pyrinomonadaceae bacterium]
MFFTQTFSAKTNIIASITSNAVVALLSIVFVPIYLRYIGVESYGLIGIFSSVQVFVVLLDFGLSSTINRELARLSAHDGKLQQMLDTKRTLEIPNWIASAGLALMLSGLAPVLAYFWIQPKNLPQHTVMLALVIMALNVSVQFSTNFYNGGLMGLQRQLLASLINIICAALRSFGSVFVLAFISSTIEAFLLWQGIIALVQFLFTKGSLNRILRRGGYGSFSKDILRSIWRFAAGMTGMTALAVIVSQADKLVLSRMLNLEDFGYYALASLISNMAIAMVAGAMYQTFYPKFSHLVSTGNTDSLSDLYHRSCQLLAVLLLPIVVILSTFSYEILLIWTKNEGIARNASILLSLIAIANGLQGLVYLAHALQLAHGWTKLSFYLNLFALMFIVPLMIFGVYHYGAIGGALGCLVTTL